MKRWIALGIAMLVPALGLAQAAQKEAEKLRKELSELEKRWQKVEKASAQDRIRFGGDFRLKPIPFRYHPRFLRRNGFAGRNCQHAFLLRGHRTASPITCGGAAVHCFPLRGLPVIHKHLDFSAPASGHGLISRGHAAAAHDDVAPLCLPLQV
jgi:hypothetical protein